MGVAGLCCEKMILKRNKEKYMGRKITGFDLLILILILLGLASVAFTAYIFHRISMTHYKLIPISVVALIIGVIVEAKRLSPKWSTVLTITLISFALSFLSFLPGRREQTYIFENHIVLWPYVFLFINVILTAIFHKEKTIPKMTEGKTSILSIGAIYWIIDYGLHNTGFAILDVILVIVFLIALFSIINTFVYITLSKPLRLFLSIWSAIIMIIFAIDYIYLTFQNGQIEDSVLLKDKIFTGMQYFLLGICSIYIFQNIMMILGFLPGRGSFFNKRYFEDLRELKKDHIDRYSKKQSTFLLSAICTITSVGFFIVNYKYEIFPAIIAIWLAFFALNSIVHFCEKAE